MTDPHLIPVVSDRGFKHLLPIPSEYGGEVRVYESSAATAPHVWLAVTIPVDPADPAGQKVSAHVHLTLTNATRLAAQLRLLVEHHSLVPERCRMGGDGS